MSAWEKFKYTEEKKEKEDKKNDKSQYYNRPINVGYAMSNTKDKIDKEVFECFVEEHKDSLEYIYQIVSSINNEIEREYFYRWSYLKTNLDYSIKEILKYNKK